MNKRILSLPLACAGILLIPSERASAIVKPFDDASEVFVTGTVSAAENDNIFLSNTNAKSALIFDFIPGLSYVDGKDTSLTQTKIDLSEDFQQYASGSTLSKQLANAALSSRYDDEKTKLNFDANFHQYDQAVVGLTNTGGLVLRDETHVDGTGELAFTDKTSAGVGVIFDDLVYKKAGYTNWEYVEVPVNYYYKVEPKLDLSAGFRYRDNTLGTGGIDSQNYYYNVGARGEFTPNLTGNFDIGYNQVKLAHGGNQSGLGADSKFTYAYSPKTSVMVGLNEDYGYSATGGGGYRLPNAYIGATTALDEQWSVNGLISYGNYQYLTKPANSTLPLQRDDFYSAQVGATYVVNTNISVRGAYNYSEDSSNIPGDSFRDNLFTISASVRY